MASSISGGWETDVVIQISEEGAAATDAAIKRVTRTLKEAQAAAKSPVNPFGKGSGSMASDFGIDKMEKATGSLFHMGVEYERTAKKMKTPLGGYDANMQLTTKNFSEAAKGLDALGNKAPIAAKKLTAGFSDAAHAVRVFRTLVIATGLEAFVSNIITTTDALTNLQNKIKVVSDSQEHANYIFTQSMAIAKETRTGISEVATVYSRTARAVQEMGVSTSATLQFTKTLSKAVSVGGSTAIEASNAMIQLSQGLASGTLKGDELRSVLEQLPVVANLIAKHLGKDVGELRKLGMQGKLTTQQVFEAIIAGTAEMDKEFAQMTPTFEKGWQAIKNGAIEASKTFQPIVTDLAQAMIDFGDSFDYVATMIDLLMPKLENSTFLKIMSYLPVKVAELAANGLEGLSFISGKLGLGDPWSAVEKASEDAKEAVQYKKDMEELARLEQEYYDSMSTPNWKTPPKEPKKEGGLTFEEMMLKAERDRERAGLPDFEADVLKDVEGRIGSLKKSAQTWIQSNDGGNPTAQLEILIKTVQKEHDMAAALKLVAQEEQYLQELREEAAKKGIAAGQHERDNLVKAKEARDAASRSYAAAINPLTAYNNAVLEGNQFIFDNQALLGEYPALYDEIRKKIDELDPATKNFRDITTDLVDIMDQMGTSIADAAADALVFGDNLGKAFDQIAKAAASQVISAFIQFGVKSLAGVIAPAPALGARVLPGGASGGFFGPGGYTGNGHIGDVAGVVHGREFVVNSNATARNRATLEAMNAGKSVGGTGATVNVHNYSGAEVQTSTNDKGEIEIMIRKAIAEQAPGVIAGDIRNANSRTAKAMNQVYESRRRT